MAGETRHATRGGLAGACLPLVVLRLLLLLQLAGLGLGLGLAPQSLLLAGRNFLAVLLRATERGRAPVGKGTASLRPPAAHLVALRHPLVPRLAGFGLALCAARVTLRPRISQRHRGASRTPAVTLASPSSSSASQPRAWSDPPCWRTGVPCGEAAAATVERRPTHASSSSTSTSPPAPAPAPAAPSSPLSSLPSSESLVASPSPSTSVARVHGHHFTGPASACVPRTCVRGGAAEKRLCVAPHVASADRCCARERHRMLAYATRADVRRSRPATAGWASTGA